MGSRTAIVRAALFEVLSEPLSLLLTLSALLLAIVAPVVHCHNFGEPARMACDAGLSALLTGGLALGIFAAVRAFRREEESGTLAMALVHPVSRASFFVSKCVGVWLGVGALMWTVFCAMVVMVRGALIGGGIAALNGDVPRVWGPSVALAVAIPLLSVLAGAAWNRFGHGRFVFSTQVLAIGLGTAALFYPWEWRLFPRLFVSAALLLLPAGVFTAAAAALAVRLRDRYAVSIAFGLLVLALPALGNYYPSVRVFNAGWTLRDALFAAGAAIPLVVGFALLGIHFLDRKDIG